MMVVTVFLYMVSNLIESIPLGSLDRITIDFHSPPSCDLSDSFDRSLGFPPNISLCPSNNVQHRSGIFWMTIARNSISSCIVNMDDLLGSFGPERTLPLGSNHPSYKRDIESR